MGQRRPGDHAGPAGHEPAVRRGSFSANGYDFVEQLLASQRKFAEDVLQATAWALPTGEDAPAKPAAAAPVRKTSTEAK